jgi:DNA repair protein RadA/Sms
MTGTSARAPGAIRARCHTSGPVSRTLTAFTCTSCGFESPRWLGRCTACGEWNSLVEEVRERPKNGARPTRAKAQPRALSEVEPDGARRLSTGCPEFDRVLGGGLVSGSLVLVGGEPGVGKSSLLLQALGAIGAAGRSTLLVSGEESPAQVRLRAERIGAVDHISILAETDLDTVCEAIAELRPEVCVVDSVQTLASSDLSSSPGSVAQVREAADRLLRIAKSHGVTIVLVGHVTKEGTVAGPRVLEHLVDAVLQLEGDRYRFLRVLRAIKNRFGSTSEIGLFEMTDAGLVPVADPSAAFAADLPAGPGSVLLPAIEGTRPILLELQALVAPSDLAMPRRQTTGIDRNRLSMIVAVLGRHAGVALGSSDVFVNVAGGVRVDEPAADLAVAVAIVSAHRGVAVRQGLACFGELSLTGGVRPVGQAERRLGEAAKLGSTEALAPAGTVSVKSVNVRTATTLQQAIEEAFA